MGLCGRCTSSKACLSFRSGAVVGRVWGGGANWVILVKEMHYKYIYNTYVSRSSLTKLDNRINNTVIKYVKPVLWAFYAYYSVLVLYVFFFCLGLLTLLLFFVLVCSVHFTQEKRQLCWIVGLCIIFSSLTDKSKSNAIKEKFSKKLKTKFLK